MQELETIKKETATEAAIRNLEKYIVGNKLTVGSRLASENELCRRLGVSRIVIREALQHFKSLNIIDSKPQRGAFVKSFYPKDPYVHYLSYLRNSRESIQEIAQMRAVFELGLCLELCDLITEDHLRELEEINNELLHSSVESRVEYDIKFHTYLLQIPQNGLLAGLKTILIDFFGKSREKEREILLSIDNRKVYDEHNAIILSFRSRSPECIRIAVQKHMTEYKEICK